LSDLSRDFNPKDFKSSGLSARMAALAPYAEVFKAEEVVSGDLALLFALITLDGGDDEVTADYLERACTAPGYLKGFILGEKYNEAYDLLQAVFDWQTERLARFGVLPKQIRFLIHDKS
jgi:hypothetical protein